MNEKKYYTEKELLQYLERKTEKRQGVDRLTTMCKQAGLIIAPVQETVKGKGSQILYEIIEDNYQIDGEVWVETYCSSAHEVSNLGRIRQKDTKRLMGSTTCYGYREVSIGQNYKNMKIHRIVYFSFHPELIPEQKYYFIDHINGKRDDNRLENLRPASNLENVNYRQQNREPIQTLFAQLLQKFGYEKTCEKIQQLLQDEN